jgi:hypothetical protein
MKEPRKYCMKQTATKNMLGVLVNHENGGDMFLRNVG